LKLETWNLELGFTGKAGIVRTIGMRYQRTLAGPAEVRGVGFITGARVRARFLPAPADTGIVFRRVDRPGSPTTKANIAEVTGSERRTTLGSAESGITLVEHVLAALAGLRIDNCTVELDGPEPPGLDGSSAGFAAALIRAGASLQFVPRPVCSVTGPIVITEDGATISIHPSDTPGLRLSYILDYGPRSPIARQVCTVDLQPENFVAGVASSRTFVTEAEARGLRAQGIGTHLTPADMLVFGSRGPIGNQLRFADEPARHKILDLIGDLSLCGSDLAGHVIGYRSGHALNAALARRLTAGMNSAVTKPADRKLAVQAA
jgi:UDP-3-O-acyl N-acetylglucosamine deacetylase